MKKFSVSVVSIVLVLLCYVSLFAAEQRVVRVGAFNFYPGIFKDTDGVVKGFYVEALNDLGRRENIRFEYVYGSWIEGLERIKAGEVDVLTSVAYTAERAAFLDYSKIPLLTVWGEVYVPKLSGIDGIRDVQGKKIAVMKGDVNGRHFIDLVKKFEITCKFVEMPGFDDVFKAVASNEVDAGVVNNTFGAAKQKEYGLRSTGIVFNPFDIFIAVAKGKNQSLLVLLDSYLDNWRHQIDSPYNQARQKWSHGSSGTIMVFPRWLIYSSTALCVLVVVAMFFILLLRRQVKLKTKHLCEEIELRKLKEAELLVRNSELERFNYTISHELKSPLVTVKSFLGFLEQDLGAVNSERINKDMDYMHVATDKMARVLDGLLEIMRVGRVVKDPVTVQFSELVQEVLALVAEPVLERRVTVQVDDTATTLFGDRARLADIWQNLVENAIKFRGEQLAPRIEIGSVVEDGCPVFYVRDNGMGIDPRYHDKIFNLFDKLDPNIEGTGVGLALVKRIVEFYRGSVWVESEGVGHGSCFRFTLPQAVTDGPGSRDNDQGLK